MSSPTRPPRCRPGPGSGSTSSPGRSRPRCSRSRSRACARGPGRGVCRPRAVPAARAGPSLASRPVGSPRTEAPGTPVGAVAQPRRSGADLVLANDPDGDRLAAAVPDPDAAGGWRTLTGDQVGALLGAYLLDRDPPGSDRLVVTTIVSSTLLSRIAAAAGAQYAETLTG